ncbi:MAG TPA: Sec-independent protein translocase subunit TatA [Nocardioidaceae bacterium]|jgi:sec-independent protein translocase protein TatA|nr:Sec-independent protein translocase subunit TatA [Nocardioidaceae bacterium]
MLRNLADNPLLLILLVLIIVLVFGANRLPGAARSLGRSMRIFKSEVKGMKEDDDRSAPDRDAAAPADRPIEGKVVDPTPHQPTEGQRRQGQDRQGAPHDSSA